MSPPIAFRFFGLPVSLRTVTFLYVAGVLISIPGETAAGLTFHYPAGQDVLLFQVFTTLSDGIGFVLLYLFVALLLRDPKWHEIHRRSGFLLVVLGGLIIASVTETLGTVVLGWWAYPPGSLVLGTVGVFPILGWSVVPPFFFYAAGRRFQPIPLALLLAVVGSLVGAGALLSP